jgi:hypothetical protein
MQRIFTGINENALENSQNNLYIHSSTKHEIMQNFYLRLFFCMVYFVAFHVNSYAQTEKQVGKVLQKSVKQVIKNPVRVPGVDLEMAGARALDLASTVNEAVNASLKESLKSDVWNADQLSTTDLMQVHTSTTPFTTFQDLSKSDALKKELTRQFEQLNISEVLDNVGGDPGFYLSSRDPDTFLDDTYANVLARLDNVARELFEE